MPNMTMKPHFFLPKTDLDSSVAQVDPDTVWSPSRLRPMLQDLEWGVPWSYKWRFQWENPWRFQWGNIYIYISIGFVNGFVKHVISYFQ